MLKSLQLASTKRISTFIADNNCYFQDEVWTMYTECMLICDAQWRLVVAIVTHRSNTRGHTKATTRITSDVCKARKLQNLMRLKTNEHSAVTVRIIIMYVYNYAI